jgi:hypothetical protein
MAPYREYVANFVRNRDVQRVAVMERVPSCCLEGQDIRATSDPLIWYASILPESTQGDADTVKSVQLLSAYVGPNLPEANLLRLSLKLYLDRREDAKVEVSAGELLAALGRARSDHLESTFSYQLACDYLASHYARFCQSATAYEWFKNEITARDNEQQYRFRPESPLWGRPPKKLVLPYMFLLPRPINCHDDLSDGDFRDAHRLLCAWGLVCDPPFGKEFDTNLLNHYPMYQKWDAWLKGTLLDRDIKLDQYINQSLDEGWRY